MINNIIFLYDATKESYDVSKEFREIMKKATKPNSFKNYIYYLEIMSIPKNSEDRLDNFYKYEVTETGQNSEELIFTGLNLRGEIDLKKCFGKINDTCFEKSQSIFISCGHGKPMFIDPVFLKIISSSLKNEWAYLEEKGNIWGNAEIVENLKQAFHNNKIPLNIQDEDSWYEERIWNKELANSLEELKPTLGIFFNCNTNFIDSMYCYSNCFRYCISTENYLSTNMMDLAGIIQIFTNQNDFNDKNFAISVYTSISGKVISESLNISNLSGASLFLTELNKFPGFVSELNLLIQQLITKYSADFQWLKDIIESIKKDDLYFDTVYGVADIAIFLTRLGKRLSGDADINNAIEQLLKKLKNNGEIILSGITTPSAHINSGITIYLPRLTLGIDNSIKVYPAAIKRYIDKYSEDLRSTFKWYPLLDLLQTKI